MVVNTHNGQHTVRPAKSSAEAVWWVNFVLAISWWRSVPVTLSKSVLTSRNLDVSSSLRSLTRVDANLALASGVVRAASPSIRPRWTCYMR